MPFYTVTVTLPADLDEDQAGRFCESLQEDALSASLLRTSDPFSGPWKLQWVFEGKPDESQIIGKITLSATLQGVAPSSPVIEPVPDINWLEHSYRQFPPFSIGPFFVYGSHFDGRIPEGQIPLQIDAATAFGSGEHGTTSGCLLLMEEMKRNGFNPEKILDMGCGSGILSIAAKKLWGAPVLAVDIDPESVRVTLNHAAANKVEIEALSGDGFAAVSGPYDLILANILPVPLKTMSKDLIAHLTPGGHALLSGMLLGQAGDVLATYEQNGIRLEKRLDRGEWSCLLLQKPV